MTQPEPSLPGQSVERRLSTSHFKLDEARLEPWLTKYLVPDNTT